jgi:hypothetical protein
MEQIIINYVTTFNPSLWSLPVLVWSTGLHMICTMKTLQSTPILDQNWLFGTLLGIKHVQGKA